VNIGYDGKKWKKKHWKQKSDDMSVTENPNNNENDCYQDS
jgi:hypothetical protein